MASPNERRWRVQEGLEAFIDREAQAPELSPYQLRRADSEANSKEAVTVGKWNSLNDQVPEEHTAVAEKESVGGQRPGERRVCGLKRRTFIVIVAIAIIVVLAAVLGGVLGTQLGGNDDATNNTPAPSSNSSQQAGQPLAVHDRSGVATISTPDGVYGYYQDQNSSIIERKIGNGSWTTSGQDEVVTTRAGAGSPLAATGVSLFGTYYRIVFFLQDNGQLMAVNRTETERWLEPSTILTNDATEPSTQALDVIQFPDFGTDVTIRVYYGSVTKSIRELGVGSDQDFSSVEWNGIAHETFLNGSDSSSGLGATSYNHLARLYMRNSTTGALVQWSFKWDSSNDYTWTLTGDSTNSNLPVANGSAITACSDEPGGGTDYVFYQTTNGSLVGALALSETSGLSNFQVLDGAVTGSKLRAFYDGEAEAATLFYHSSGDPVLSMLKAKRTGEVFDQGTVKRG